jgi:VanZ family protein
MERDTRRLALASVIAGIGAATLIPVHAGFRSLAPGSVLAAFRHGDRFFSWPDAGQNILLFLPLGALIAMDERRAGRPWLRAGAIALALSSAIEIAQAFLPGRFASLWDIAFNTLGGALGAWMAARLGRRSDRAAGPGEGPADQTASG